LGGLIRRNNQSQKDDDIIFVRAPLVWQKLYKLDGYLLDIG